MYVSVLRARVPSMRQNARRLSRAERRYLIRGRAHEKAPPFLTGAVSRLGGFVGSMMNRLVATFFLNHR
jgi:hypothetical protein